MLVSLWRGGRGRREGGSDGVGNGSVVLELSIARGFRGSALECSPVSSTRQEP